MRKVLFLNGSDKAEFYNNERNKYQGVVAGNIFLNNSITNRILRKLMLLLKSELIWFLFGRWKQSLDSYDVIILSVSRYSPLIYSCIRNISKIKIIHWYWNPIITEIAPREIKTIDTEIFSFDSKDCDRYKIRYISTYYFSTIKLEKNEIEYDIYFMGEDKGRLTQLLELSEVFNSFGLSVHYHITRTRGIKSQLDYVYKERITYSKVLDGISKCKAILDIVQVGQDGLSQRPLEALFHRKKLITNNLSIINYDFYCKNNIFIINHDRIEDLEGFINSPFTEVDAKILMKYDFRYWVDFITA